MKMVQTLDTFYKRCAQEAIGSLLLFLDIRQHPTKMRELLTREGPGGWLIGHLGIDKTLILFDEQFF